MVRMTGRLIVTVALVTSIFAFEAHDRTVPRAPESVVGAATPNTAAYVPVEPCRLADSRRGLGFIRIDDSTAKINTEACDIPREATSVVVSTTIVNPGDRGWLVASASGESRQTAATLTWKAHDTRANTATVAVGADRHIAVYRTGRFGDGAVIVDVVGAFVPATSASAGRLRPEPTARRLLDTRSGRRPTAGSTLTIALPPGIPADTTALAVNITAVRNAAEGFVSTFPAGTEQPDTSVLNTDRAGQFRAAATIVPVTPAGFEIYVSAATHLIVDVTGSFTGEAAADSDDGLFVAINPTRLRDTRPQADPIHPGGTIDVALPPLTGGAAAAAYSVTMIAPGTSGYLTAHAAGTPRGATSSGYGERGDLTSQFGIAAASARGVALFADAGSEVTFDLLGYFTGAPSAITSPGPPGNIADRQRVIAIGDSSLAGIDRNRAWAQLRGADIDLRARSCRRLVRTSCRGLEGPIPPPNALQELRSLAVGSFDIAVIMTGYNEAPSDIVGAIPLILDAARAKGIRHVIWLTHSREFRFDKGGSNLGEQVYASHNDAIRAAAVRNADMTAVEWSRVTRQVPFWLYSDGLHLDKYGGHGAADFISRAIAHIAGQRCPMPQFPGAPIHGVCPDPGYQPPVDIAGLYGI